MEVNVLRAVLLAASCMTLFRSFFDGPSNSRFGWGDPEWVLANGF